MLQRSGALSGGEVAGFDLEDGRGNWSSNLRLRLHYSPDARGDLPAGLFLKMVDTDLGDGEYFDDSEVTYYRRDYLDVPEAPLVRCYDGVYSPELRRYHLLLDDHSHTHIQAQEKSPTLEYGLALAEGLAALHARWWGAERLAERGASIHDEAHIRRFAAIAEPGVGHILGRFSAELEPHWPAMLKDLFAAIPPTAGRAQPRPERLYADPRRCRRDQHPGAAAGRAPAVPDRPPALRLEPDYLAGRL